MAKQQDLPLSPMEISGVCGRLLCCLAYEDDLYAQVKKSLPKRGAVIDTPHGRGRVVQVNVVRESVQVELENQVTVEVSYADLEAAPPPRPKSQAPARRRGRRRRRPRS
jgi:cell fate regulator YaaT (PSP1 superfamily)